MFIRKLQKTVDLVVSETLTENKAFTGKIVLTVDCKNGGIGSLGVYVQKKIKKIKNIDILSIF